MRTSYLRTARLALASLFALAAFALACGPTEQSIRDEIDAANHCTVASDCASAGGACPFGCFILVNKAEVAHIQSLLADWQSNCAYDCAALKEILCTQGKCEGDFGF
ncbi:MAG: hypothetical protein U0359_07950 [Byssovorax sp.]